ncbi:MAG: hypothetical protein CME66_10035 [Halobacteriovoraceae bacterium]|jgi:magnesium transporter|nr:hypothetical protein [Halobacteriovoraceae bacterium]|tara:strand:+ start:391 stop:1263 length:873 start_codon:yes stop_codon:yes gene_type:complete
MSDLREVVDPLHIEDLNEKDHYSVFYTHKNYKILIIRGFKISKEGLEYRSRGFLFNNEGGFYHYNRGEKDFIQYEKGISDFVSVVEPIYKQNTDIIDSFGDEIDELEDILFERKSHRVFMDVWFDLKKDLSRIERHYTRHIRVLKEFYKHFAKVESFPEQEFHSLLEEVQLSLTNTTHFLARLDAIHHYYSSIKNDRLNKNIFMLTLLSAVFLPLNLIVGFFGMNTPNLFLQNNPNGTQLVFIGLLTSLAISIFGLPVVRFIDYYLLRFFLGKYDIYKKASDKINKALKI